MGHEARLTRDTNTMTTMDPYINIEMWTENSILGDVLIGRLRLKCSALAVNDGVDDWWTLTHDDKSVGQVHLSSNWKPHNTGEGGTKAAEPAAQAPAPQQQQPAYQQPMQQPMM